MKCITKTLILLVACCQTASYSHAQTITRSTDTAKKTQPSAAFVKPKGPRPITREFAFGIQLNSNGWSAYTDIAHVKSKDPKHSDMFYDVAFWRVEFTEKKNPREQKIQSENPSISSSSSTYIYGKINNFYSAKLGWGYRKMLAGKPDPGTVSIHWASEGGFALGMLKPYYLNVNSDPSAIQFSDATKSDFLDKQAIEGHAGLMKGINQLSFIPGGHIKSAIHFDFSTNRKNALGADVGMNFEYYSKAVPILANQKPASYFFDIFLAFQYGRRW